MIATPNKTMKNLFSIAIFNLFLCISVFGQLNTPINVIQGDAGVSLKANSQVTTRGIVTAIIKKGFYIQTPDAEIDKSSKTSEGIFVFTNDEPTSISIGDLVDVSGSVLEYKPRAEKYALPLTQITKPRVNVVSKGNPLPKPIVLTAIDVDPKGKIDQMERFEGMRVKINSLTVSAGTGGRIDDKKGIAFTDGIFYGVLSGTPRPLKETGLDILDVLGEKLPNNIWAFDMNPENLRFDSDTQIGNKQLHVAVGEVIKNVVGVVDYARRSYTILIDANNPLTVENKKSAVAVATAKEREVTVGSFNLENFFDEEVNSDNVEKEAVTPKNVFEGRLNKASLAIRNVLSMPDVLGIVEVENIKVLKRLADKINADAVAANQNNPKYEAYLEEGNDMRGIDVGYLIKSTKVKVLEVKQLGKDVKPEIQANSKEMLFDRPSLMLRAEVVDSKTNKPFEFTTIVVHFKSYSGINDPQDGKRVQNKKRQQAEWLANFVAERAKTNPTERMILCGDFNAFQFPDGYNDVMGTLLGKADQNVLTPSKANYKTGLGNLIYSLPANQHYSFIFNGNGQAIDHILINANTLKNVFDFKYARIDSDFPLVYYNDYNRPERLSDHDAPIVYLSLDEIKAPSPK